MMSNDVSITDMLLAVLKMGGSDVFIAEGKVSSIRMHGEVRLLKQDPISKQTMEEFLQKFISTDLRRDFDTGGDLDIGVSIQGHRFRLNIAKQQGQISIVARPLPIGRFEFEDLGLPLSLAKLSDHKSGLVLVTGATGSGKSTTLASMIHYINQHKRVHVVTIEDPIEFVHSDIRARITQREVGVDTNSFSEGLRRVVRQSPDVILIGEMRDEASIQVAMSAALTGHLVLATLHTINAAQTLQRLMSYFPEHARAQVAVDLSLALRGIVSQRLIPKKDGKGRVVAVEILTNTPAVSQLLREERYSDLEDIMRSSRTDEIRTFNTSLVELTENDVISKEVGVAYSSNPDEYHLLLQGMGNSSQAFLSSGPKEKTDVPDIKRLLQLAVTKGASDLHLTVGRSPIIRVTGELTTLIEHQLSSADMRMLLFSVMNGRQRTVYELEKEVDFSLGLRDGRRFRVNAYYQKGNMAAALRAIPSEIPDPELMFIPKQIMTFCDKPHGLILVVGPTGSGKSTTLACMIDRINKTRKCRIITVEDPIEFTHRSILATIDQREVFSDTKSFGSALKYILRQDPDVILVGEMRDQETISAALTAAETGHLVFATLHTNNAVQTINRIIDVFPSHQQEQIRAQISSSLLAVFSQRLLRKKNGRGRIPAFEIMIGSNAICNMIRENKMHQALGMMEASKEAGMITMDRALRDLFVEGFIGEEEAVRFMANPQSLKGPSPTNKGFKRY
jgi:pilus retraction protein PilT